MKRTRKQSFLTRLFGRADVISQAELDRRLRCCHDYIEMTASHNQRLDRLIIEKTAQIKKLQSRADELEPAFAECVAGLRKIRASQPHMSPFETAICRREIAEETLGRLQIPVDDLPWARCLVQETKQSEESDG